MKVSPDLKFNVVVVVVYVSDKDCLNLVKNSKKSPSQNLIFVRLIAGNLLQSLSPGLTE